MQHFDLIIIGTGSGNSILDERFRGRKVALIERDKFGGTCLNVGCIPTKMLVYTADVAATPSRSSRLGVDETLDNVRWSDIRDRIFADRIDQIAAGGRDYRLNHEDNANVTVFEGDARFTGPKQLTVAPNDGGTATTITGDEIVLAAGGRPSVPDIEGLADVDFHTSDTVMRLERLPASMTILGSGFIAAEFAHVFAALGVAVTLVARSGALLRAQDAEVSERFTEIARGSWDVRLNTATRKVEQYDGGIRLHVESPDGPGVIESEVLLVATGRTPNTDQLDVAAGGLETDEAGLLKVDEFQRAVVGGTRGENGAVAGGAVVPGVWALGDICSPYQLKHVANHEQRVVQHNLVTPDALVASDHRFVPHAVFSSPQVASVGLTEEQARARGLEISVARQDYGGIAYGWAMEDTTGFAKLLADKNTGMLVGAHIIGPQASSLLQPLIQAMSFGQPVKNLARGQYWIHPSLPELIENALLQLDA
ncbi:mycothione reductase [Zhihengliuella halotolerans]|uniref:Mycothione reductase n=1 Tax=Zhihengliuella halotolerans TaxID=370736 RepID=A0A4Q8AF48_9MICC|nr:mycothione reductase [Zhihengliuella halotolerans]RZU62927.1 mycothione reductase [Zhihengliuella halotolerans]